MTTGADLMSGGGQRNRCEASHRGDAFAVGRLTSVFYHMEQTELYDLIRAKEA